MRHLRHNCNKPEIDFLKDLEFADFRASLDAEMKRLQSAGVGSIKKQAEPLTIEDEELLLERKLLGDHSPEALLNTMDCILPCAVEVSTVSCATVPVKSR